MDLRDSLLASLVAAIWGFNFVVIDWGMSDVPPLLFLAVRFAVVLVPAVFLVPRPDVAWTTILGIGSLMSLGQFVFLYLALDAGMPPGLAALVLQGQVVFTVVIAATVLRERPRPLQVVGVGIGVIGLVVVAVGRGGDVALLPFVLCLLAALSWGAGNVVSRASGVSSGLSLTVWSALVVPIPALVLALATEGPTALVDGLDAFGWTSIVSTLYTAGLASLAGYGIFNTLLSRHRSADVVPFVLLAPVVAIASAAVLLDQVPNRAEAAGAVVMIAGVLVALRASRTSPRSALHEATPITQTGVAAASPGSVPGDFVSGSDTAARR
ncbi:MAG: EamA family transporter [Ilumatobacter sp.]|uniref:EamA family transporter n=1 Tax=Ilumatobacter sp. TaxID=1967498 RepID=UPI0032989C57